MKKTIVLYSLAIAAAAFALQWVQYLYTVRVFSTEIYIGFIALGFTMLGIWVGHRLAGGSGVAKPFEKNHQAIAYLGISEREVEVLELLAEGHSNKEIGEHLFVSPNTIKTHLANLYGKLEVSRRTQAVQKARALAMIP
jgi:DNA-binding CsgD family transcriptional regulator